MSRQIQPRASTPNRASRPRWIGVLLGTAVAVNVVVAAMSLFTVAEELGGSTTTTSQVPVEQVDTAQADQCDSTEKTLEVAYQGWVARYGGVAGSPSESDLVATGFLPAEVASYDLVGANVVAVAGGDCAITS